MIKLVKHLIGRADKFLIGGEGMGRLDRATKQLRQHLVLVGLGQRLKGLQKIPRRFSHGGLFYARSRFQHVLLPLLERPSFHFECHPAYQIHQEGPA